MDDLAQYIASLTDQERAEVAEAERQLDARIEAFRRRNRTEGICLYCGREDFHNEVCPNFVDDDYTS